MLTKTKTMITTDRKEKETTSLHLGRREHRLELLVRIVRRLVRNVVIPGTSFFFLFLLLFRLLFILSFHLIYRSKCRF
jgi:hypothetical protein